MARNKAIITALGSNLTIAAMKYIVAAVSGSASMFSEAVHSTADSINQVVLLFGKRIARRPPDERHPFGYARATFFASFCVVGLLFFVGGAFSLLEAVEKVGAVLDGSAHAHDLASYFIALAILAVAIGLEGFSLRTALKEAREVQELSVGSARKASIFNFFRSTREASLIVILIEDLAALLGLVLAFFGVLLTLVTGNQLFDAIGGAAVGVLLIVAAAVLGREIASLIIGEGLAAEEVAQIRELINKAPHVQGCRDIKTLVIGSNALLVEADVIYPADQGVSTAQVMESVARIKADIHQLLQQEDIHISTCIEAVSGQNKGQNKEL
ncbi:MAG: cation diffusion facilitator family transporter [Actinomycetia bacterium]|nr:cation diffusion facilitator family transporter [Actinomycetes bacterium]